MKNLFHKFWFRLLLINLLIIGGLSGIIIYRYSKSQTWNSSVLANTQNNIDPELARNTYSPEMTRDLRSLSRVTDVLQTAQRNGVLAAQDREQARQVYQKANSILRKYKIKNGQSKDQVDCLKVYLDVDDFLDSAYKIPNAKAVNDLIGRVSNENLHNAEAINNNYLTKLSSVAASYNKLNDFIADAFNTLGISNNGIIDVKADVSASDVRSLNKEISKNDLTKYSAVRKFKKLINGSHMTHVIDRNNSQKAKDKWAKALHVFDSMTQSQYQSVSSINDVADAKKAKIQIDMSNVSANQKLSDDSLVVKLTLHGTELSNDLYFKIGAPVVATIKPEYEESEKKTDDAQFDVDAKNANDSDTHSQSSSSSSSNSSSSSSASSQSQSIRSRRAQQSHKQSSNDDGWTTIYQANN